MALVQTFNYFVFKVHQIINCYNFIYLFLQKMSSFLKLPIKSSKLLFSVSNLLKSNWVGICWERRERNIIIDVRFIFLCYNWLDYYILPFIVCIPPTWNESHTFWTIPKKKPISTNYIASLTILSFKKDCCVVEIAPSVAGSIEKSSFLLIWTEYLKYWK
jgi:hypothetical protein